MSKKTSSKREIRVLISPQKFEIRKNSDGTRSIGGYAATFGDLSENLGGFREVIRAGAFKQSLEDTPDVLCLYGHDDNQILGRVASGTLQVSEDSKGLRFTCQLPDTTTARDLMALMERGDVSQMSFGFAVPQGGDEWAEIDGQLIRTLTRVILWEISVCGQPAYTSSSVSLRSVPKAFRAKLKRNDPDDDDDPNYDPDDIDDAEDDSEGERKEDRSCDCECGECVAGNCEDCIDEDCDDPNCDCPMQTRAAHLDLLTRRLR